MASTSPVLRWRGWYWVTLLIVVMFSAGGLTTLVGRSLAGIGDVPRDILWIVVFLSVLILRGIDQIGQHGDTPVIAQRRS